MAITFVGSNVTVSSAVPYTPTILSLPASVPGDLVLVFMGTQDGSGGGPPTTPGYTTIAAPEHTFTNVLMTASYKLMGATPDTTVTFPAMVFASTSLVAGALVFRGCHSAAQPQDVLPVVINNGETLVLAAPITPLRDNDCVVIAAIGIPDNPGIGSVPGFLPSPAVQVVQAPFTLGVSYRIAVGGALTTVTPTPWSTWRPGPLVRFLTVTIALRATADIVPVVRSSVTLARKTVTLRETVAPVARASVAFVSKAVTLKETVTEIIPVSSARVDYTGSVITIPSATTDIIPVSRYRIALTGKTVNVVPASIDTILVSRYKVALTGKTVNVTDVTRAVTVTSASVLCRGGTVNPREVTFQDVPPFLTVKGRGSDVLMETR